MKFFEAFANMFRVPDLRKRLLFTLGLLAVYRLGSQVPTPGINLQRWADFFAGLVHGSELSTVTVLMSKAKDSAESLLVFAAILLTGLVCYVTLRAAEPIQKRLGTTGIHVLGRILGLVLAGIAVQFVLDGLAAAGLVPKVAVK